MKSYTWILRLTIFCNNKLDEPDLNLVSIFDLYHFRDLQSNVQASLICGKHRVKIINL